MKSVHPSRLVLAWLRWRGACLYLVAVMLAVFVPDARAQTESHLLLVAPPLPAHPSDSAFALKIADELRKKIRSWDRVVVSSREMCQMLRASDYPCGTILSDADVEHLADALRTDAYLTGSLRSGPDLSLELRVTARNRSGFAGSLQLLTAADVKPDSVAALAEQGLDAFWFSAALTRRCYEARDEGELADAVFLAEGALSMVPNHSAAALCLATVYELTNESIPKRIDAYAQAFRSDPRLAMALRRLVGLYFEYGDTLSGNVLLTEQLRREPDDATMRMQLAYNWISLSLSDSAFTVLHPHADGRDENLALLQLIWQACLDREMWQCNFETLERQYELDSALARDTTFYYRVVGAAQQAGNHLGVLQWTKAGVERVGRSPDGAGMTMSQRRRFINSLWLAHAEALVNVGARDSAVAVYLQVGRTDPVNAQPLLAAAEVLVDPRFLTIDSAAPLDTAALQRCDSVLTVVARSHRDEAVLQRVSSIYFTKAAALVQHRIAPRLASTWLEKAMHHDVSGRTHETAHALNGLALAHVVQLLDADIRNDGTCDMVDEIEAAISRSREATEIGRTVMPDVTDQILARLDEYANLIPQYRAVLRCGIDTLEPDSVPPGSTATLEHRLADR